MFRRIVPFAALFWLIGFAWFAIFMPQPAGEERTGAAAVFTGGEGRVARGLDVIARGLAPRLLVSGVGREVKPSEFSAEYEIPAERMACCVTLGYESVDTRANADETARWLANGKAQSVRLVTSDWHMRRAALELSRAMPEGFPIVRDAVPSHPSLRTLFTEYHKYLARCLAQLWEG
ncbi:MAG: YdcF family protein [Alphaproteobacteria bacterium]|nr:YdcF family protein [Alphaproteobacteria bacterium]